MELLKALQEKHILVIGDLMLDAYVYGEVKRISPEAPIPVLLKRREAFSLGGSGNVAGNIAAAGQQVSLMALISDDENGKKLITELENRCVDVSLLYQSKRPTTVKTRFMDAGGQQLLRVDVEETNEISEEDCDWLLDQLAKKIEGFDLIVLSDYLKGLLSESFTQGVIRLANEHGIKAIVDVKDPRAEKYAGAFLLKPNLAELRAMTGMPVDNEDAICLAAQTLRARTRCDYVLTTLGAKGMMLTGERENITIKAEQRDVYDVTGAGDTAIAYLAAAIANGLSVNDAMQIANCAAGLQVSKLGTSVICLWEVAQAYGSQIRDDAGKRLQMDMVRKLRENCPNKRIVFTNGCFDLLHIGHIRYLRQAAQLGDMLVVGLNSDASVRRLKGEGRPINSEEERAELLCALGFVDYVVIFDEDTPYHLIERLQPDVLVKGGDYRPEEVVGKDIVEKRGGQLVLIDFVEGKSTTGLIRRIAGAEKSN